MNRLMCVPLNSFGKSTNRPTVATVHAARLVAHLDGKAQITDADLVNAQLAVVARLCMSCNWFSRRNFARDAGGAIQLMFEHGKTVAPA